MRQIYSRNDDGSVRCAYNPDVSNMDWYTHDCCAEDMDIPVTAGVTYWIAVTGAVGRAAEDEAQHWRFWSTAQAPSLLRTTHGTCAFTSIATISRKPPRSARSSVMRELPHPMTRILASFGMFHTGAPLRICFRVGRFAYSSSSAPCGVA